MSEYYGIDSDKPTSVYWNLHEASVQYCSGQQGCKALARVRP
jgi:hypothetical protein